MAAYTPHRPTARAATTDLTSDAVYWLDAVHDARGEVIDFVFRGLSEAAEAELGLPADELVGQRLCVRFPTHRQPGCFDVYRRVHLTGEELTRDGTMPEGERASGRYRQRICPTPTGVVIVHRDTTVLANAHGALGIERDRPRRAAAAFGVTSEATRESEAQRRERALVEPLEPSPRVEALGRLAAGIAHDFNNLLAVISAEAELLRGATGEEADRAAATIRDTAEMGRRLVRELLTVGGRTARNRRSITPQRLLDKVERLAVRLLPRNVQLVVRVDGLVPDLAVDVDELQHALMNLVTNARDALPEHGGTIRITARRVEACCEGDGQVEIEVADDGRGIPPEVVPKLFDPFFTTKAAGQGTGLGLSAVHAILEGHGGCVHIESELGGGSRFRLRLPVSNPTTTDALPEYQTLGDVQADTPVRLLLVDDNLPVLRSVARLLERRGAQVTAESSAHKALERLDREAARFDRVAIDLDMPEMHGTELARTIGERWPKLDVVFLSGARSGGTVDDRDALAKPLGPRDIARLVG